MPRFTHLRTVSGFSLRYGASHPERLAERAAERDMDALALTDRDTLAGAVRFAKACAEEGIRPLFGVELAVGERDAEGTRTARTEGRSGGARTEPRSGGGEWARTAGS
ncbi:PHP domain-containing protein, partial [Streptomyces sp. SID3212]|uniref:PHP domain-containing protein n=1 Tax=Streptomyces sp. SID3212 TaxID=2690259 RepID=UPI001F007E50